MNPAETVFVFAVVFLMTELIVSTVWPHLRRLLRDQAFVSRTPIISVALLEMANVQQLYQMWTERTAAGQSLWAWICVWLALWLWLNFYLVKTPGERWAIRGTILGLTLNSAVIATVIYWRYV